MSEELRKLREGYRELNRLAGTELLGLNREQLHWRPAPKVWSIAQCLQHLEQTTAAYLPKMRQAMANTNAAKPADGIWYKFLSRMILSLESSNRRLKAPGKFVPAAQSPETGSDVSAVIQGFVAVHEEVAQLLAQIEDVEVLSTVRVQNPVLPILKLTLGQCFLLFILHGKRHFGQIQRLKQHREFPGITNRE